MNFDNSLLDNRILWVDWVKCIAIIAILFIHTSSSYMVDVAVGTPSWSLALFFESISRCGIILFVMASGFLLLRKEYDLKEFLVKRFSRVLIPFVFWNFICIIVKLLFMDPLNGQTGVFPVLSFVVRGYLDPTIVTVQFWFIYMILGLYLVTPILAKWLKNANDRDIIYLLAVCFAILIINFLNIPFLLSSYINLFTGFVGFFVLGYFIAVKRDTYTFLQSNKLAAIFVLIGFLGIFIGTFIMSSITGEFNASFMSLGDLTPFALLEAAGVYMLILINAPKIKNQLLNYAVVKISIASFGIYLCNILVINLLEKVGILSTTKFSLFIIVAVIIVLVISYIVLVIMNKIPILNKFSTLSR